MQYMCTHEIKYIFYPSALFSSNFLVDTFNFVLVNFITSMLVITNLILIEITESYCKDIQVCMATCFYFQVTGVVPDMSVVRAILKITWASASGQVHLITSSLDEIEKATESER